MGLHIYIYKNNLGDCTNNGISSKKIKGLTITNIDAPFVPCKDYPPVKLILQKFSHGNRIKIQCLVVILLQLQIVDLMKL